MKLSQFVRTALAFAATAGVASFAHAAVPAQGTIEGVLTSSGGGPAADGNYQMTFGIYAGQSGGTAVWSEGPVTVSAKGGQFVHQLGSKNPMIPAALSLPAAWLSVQIGTDPELARQPLGATVFSQRAAIAEALDCSGCVKVGALDSGVLQPYAKTTDLGAYAKAADLSGYAKTADLGPYAKTADLTAYAKVASLATIAGTGSWNDLKDKPALGKVATSDKYSDLTGLPVLAKVGEKCGTGLVLLGFKAADGSLDCGPVSLPADAIDEISNNLIHNQFVDSTAGALDTPIPNGSGAGVSTQLTFPDIGLAQEIWVDVDLTNSDVSKVKIEAFGPNMSTPYVLYNGTKSGTSLKASFNKDTAIATGDMTKDWVGKNIAGNWSITVRDPYKATGDTAEYDGKFNWSVHIKTLSSKKIQIKGNLIVDGTLQVGGTAGAITGQVTFKDHVTFQDSWCPSQPNGNLSTVLGGVCTPGVGASMNWDQAVAYCSARKADLCSDAQSLVLRRHGAIANYTSWANWTNSFGDNDADTHHEAVGPNGDDHNASNAWQAPCCYNVTPQRSTDEVVKVNPTDKGVRVLTIHNVADVTFQYAAAFCARMNADLCDKSQYVYLRTAGKISANFFWPNDGQDTDGAIDYGTAGPGATMPNDVHFNTQNGAFACCATDRVGLGCPAGALGTDGVCTVKINNTGANWVTAARDCGALGAHICSVSQNSVLRKKGLVTATSSWSAGMNDCDSYCDGAKGNGSVSNNIDPNSTYGYACCL